jgi:hypothetical protein
MPSQAHHACWCCRLPAGLNGELPANLQLLSSLTIFAISNSPQMGGTIPPSWFTSWTQLQSFRLQNTSVNGTLPEPWACPNLTSYTIRDTPVTSGAVGAADQLWLLDPRARDLLALQTVHIGEVVVTL